MIQLDVELAKSGGNCFDDVMATIDLRYRKGIEMMYIDSIRFRFDSSSPDPLVGNRMWLDYSNMLPFLETYHGYRLRFHQDISPEQAMELIKEQFQLGIPVGLYLDSYSLPWDPKFGMTHYTRHIILAVGMEPQTGLLLCSDPFFWKDRLPLEQRYFTEGFCRCMTFEMADPVKTEQHVVWGDVHRRLREWAESGGPTVHFPPFFEAFTTMDLTKENEGYHNFSETPIFTGINALCIARSNFAKTLSWLSRRCHSQSMKTMSLRMEQIAHGWSIIRSMLVKMNVMSRHRKHLEIMKDMIHKMGSAMMEEQRFLEQLLQVFDHSDMDRPDSPIISAIPSVVAHSNEDVRQIVHVPLGHLFNNQGIENGNHTADFNMEGHCFSREGSFIEAQDARSGPETLFSFAFPLTTTDDEADNVICMRQTVELDGRPVKGVMVLGSCEHGSYTDMLKIEYADGTSEEVPLGFAEWDIPKPVNGEVPYWRSRILSRDSEDNLTNDVYMYAANIPLAENKKGARLVLPYVPTLHLFAISVWN